MESQRQPNDSSWLRPSEYIVLRKYFVTVLILILFPHKNLSYAPNSCQWKHKSLPHEFSITHVLRDMPPFVTSHVKCVFWCITFDTIIQKKQYNKSAELFTKIPFLYIISIWIFQM